MLSFSGAAEDTSVGCHRRVEHLLVTLSLMRRAPPWRGSPPRGGRAGSAPWWLQLRGNRDFARAVALTRRRGKGDLECVHMYR